MTIAGARKCRRAGATHQVEPRAERSRLGHDDPVDETVEDEDAETRTRERIGERERTPSRKGRADRKEAGEKRQDEAGKSIQVRAAEKEKERPSAIERFGDPASADELDRQGDEEKRASQLYDEIDGVLRRLSANPGQNASSRVLEPDPGSRRALSPSQALGAQIEKR